jgi:hypothetical protein
MSDRVIYVVGDGFARVVADRLFTPLSQLLRLLVDGTGMGGAQIAVLPGQGLGEEDVAEVLTRASISPWRGQFDLTDWYHRPTRAVLDRYDAAEVLISTPRRVAKTVFEFDLMIDRACALMAESTVDLSRSLLREAAWQAAIAVAPLFDPDGLGLIAGLQESAAGHDRFVLGLDARIRCALRPGSYPGRSIDIVVDQGETPVTAFNAVLTPAFEVAAVA